MIEGQNDLDNTPRIPAWRGYLYVFIFWGLIACSIYLIFFVLWYSGLVPFAFVQPLFKRKIQKYRLPIIPFQKRLCKQLEKYQKFVVFRDLWRCSLTDKRGLIVAGFMLLGASVIIFSVNYGIPVLDLKDMIKIQGTYLNSQKLAHRNACGAHYLLSFRRVSGSKNTIWKGFYSGSFLDIRNLEINKKNPVSNWIQLTIWAQPSTRDLAPECRKIPHIMQILGPGTGIEIRYRKEYAVEAKTFSDIVFLFLAISGSFCIFRALWNCQQQNRLKNQGRR